MAPKSVVGICFFITAPSINHQYIFLLCCTSGCKDHFVVLVALVNPTSSFNRSYWSIVLETDSSIKLHLVHCCCRCHYNDVFGDKIEYSSWQVDLPYFTIFGQLIGWYCSNFYPPPLSLHMFIFVERDFWTSTKNLTIRECFGKKWTECLPNLYEYNLGLGKDSVYNLGTEMFTIIKISSKNWCKSVPK